MQICEINCNLDIVASHITVIMVTPSMQGGDYLMGHIEIMESAPEVSNSVLRAAYTMLHINGVLDMQQYNTLLRTLTTNAEVQQDEK